MKEFVGIIYKATNIVNGKVYIGQTTKNFKKYIQWHLISALKNKDKNKKYFYNAIRKYGIDIFYWEIIDEAYSKTELNDKEKEWIWFYYSNNSKFGYNMTKGGEGGDCVSLLSNDRKKERSKQISEKTKGKTVPQFIKDKNSGENNYHYGKTDEDLWEGEKLRQVKENRKNASKGKNNGMYNKTHSQDVKLRISSAQIKLNLKRGKENHPSYKNIDLNLVIKLLMQNNPYLFNYEIEKIIGITYYIILDKIKRYDNELYDKIKIFRKEMSIKTRVIPEDTYKKIAETKKKNKYLCSEEKKRKLSKALKGRTGELCPLYKKINIDINNILNDFEECILNNKQISEKYGFSIYILKHRIIEQIPNFFKSESMKKRISKFKGLPKKKGE